ncbi:hypothetical protein SUGI_0237010 [Cryptomeria japonica]|nr:hypothetical protein SUGI_0237010 [Cryptomeria japonica]
MAIGITNSIRGGGGSGGNIKGSSNNVAARQKSANLDSMVNKVTVHERLFCLNSLLLYTRGSSPDEVMPKSFIMFRKPLRFYLGS